ncbi:hypothetical protein F5883DRAFT_133950 [Diaporthe sp. PMI_573]|nr:hypothetical protein F5883DRAFT_133950 [Diaporthaceae sp. PMI_573]
MLCNTVFVAHAIVLTRALQNIARRVPSRQFDVRAGRAPCVPCLALLATRVCSDTPTGVRISAHHDIPCVELESRSPIDLSHLHALLKLWIYGAY